MNRAHLINTLLTWRDECISRGLPEQAVMFDGLAMLMELDGPLHPALGALIETAAS